MLNLANVRPGGRYVAVDDASGLVVSGILERMGGTWLKSIKRYCQLMSATGEGRLITICDTDSPPAYPVITNMNFKPSVISGVLASLNWATSEEDYTPRKFLHPSGTSPSDSWLVIPPSDIPADQIKSERHKSRMNKRKAVSDLLTNTRDELFAGEFDASVFLLSHTFLADIHVIIVQPHPRKRV
jgi:tRNA (adenine58-N1)-methyltransferase non-catalytic subunit